MLRLIKTLPKLIRLTYQGWKEKNPSRLAAALAYYTLFSLAPMLVIAIAVASLIFGQREVVQEQVLQQIQGLIGEEGRILIAGLLDSASKPAQGILATIIGLVTLILGALGLFNELHNSLNIIWDVKEESTKNFWETFKKVVLDRFLSFTMILGIGFMLLVSLVVSAGTSALGTWIGGVLPFHELLLQIINLVVSIAIITVLFALIFKYLPDAEIAWRDVWLGAFVTAVLFSIGKTLIGLYLGSSAVATAFGAAGSLVLLLLWAFYSTQILLFGAEFTQVYANVLGSRIVPEEGAVSIATQPATTTRTPVPSSGIVSPGVNTSRQIIPVTGPVYEMNPRIEKENRQTARFFMGLMTASFLTGILTTLFGMKKIRTRK